MQMVKRFNKNVVGNDYVVGDIHGCFSTLQSALNAIGFNGERDRLFCVGDLVDRGPESQNVCHWLNKGWFHSIRGNHEEMAIMFVNGELDRGNYFSNGGAWMFQLDNAQQRNVAHAFSSLPLIIEVESESGLVGLVHAEPKGNNWEEFIEVLQEGGEYADYAADVALWSRKRISAQLDDKVVGVNHIFVGHTPLKETRWLGNIHYIDTGCVFGRVLTICHIDGSVVHQEKCHSRF